MDIPLHQIMAVFNDVNPHVFLYFAHAQTEVTKIVFGVFNEVGLKPVSTATGTSKKIEISLDVS